MKAVFVFSHPVLFRAWDSVTDRLYEQGIEAVVASQMTPLDWDAFSADEVARADAVYLNLSRHFPSFDPLVEAAESAVVAVGSGIETQTALPGADPTLGATIDRYLKAGSTDDLESAVKLLLHRSGKLDAAPAPPSAPLLCGVLDVNAGTLCQRLDEFIATKTAQDRGNADLPLVALCFGRSLWVDGDLDLPKAAIQAIEKRGFLPLPICCDWDLATTFGQGGDHPLARILSDCGDRLVCIWNALFSHTGSRPDGASPFERYGVPVFQVIRHYGETAAEWQKGADGLSPMTICYSLTQPEMLGCIEPTLLACNRIKQTRRVLGTVNEADVVEERIERLAARTASWHHLAHQPASEKRVAIMLHNAPCKSVEATLATAAGLDAAESAVQLMRLLADNGYSVQNVPKSGAELIDRFLEHKAIAEFRWTTVDEIVRQKGALSLVDEERYTADFARLDPAVQANVVRAWGEFPGEGMVHRDDEGKPSLVVTGLEFGNVLVMIEPKRGCYGPKCDGEVCRILHEPDIPPTHQFLATYFFLQRHVDGIVPMGADSPVEYLPGKRAGLSGQCFGEIALGKLPVVYPYLMTATGEGLIAKRRGRAVLIDHLSPPKTTVTDLFTHLDDIDELYRQYRAAEAVNDGARLNQVEERLREALQEANLIGPGASDSAFAALLQHLPPRLSKLRNRTVELEPHVLGRVPSSEFEKLYISEMGPVGVSQGGAKRIKKDLAGTTNEMNNLLLALDGRFVPTGPSGHLSRGKVDVLPTGRNFYGLDLKTVPTRAAYEVGRTMGEQLLAKYLDEENRFPESIGITLWSSDVFRAEGELIGQILWLLGCAPKWGTGDKVEGVRIVPLSDLTMNGGEGNRVSRPRIDVVVQMSGVVRDTLPVFYEMIDDAVGRVAALDEPDEVNCVRRHISQRLEDLQLEIQDEDTSTLRKLAGRRVFSSKPGSFGMGVNLALDASAWNDDADLAEAFVNWTGYAYGKGSCSSGGELETAALEQYADLIRSLDVAYQKASAAEYDALSCSCYSGFQGGMAAAKRGLGGGETKLYWGDSVTASTPEVRDLAEEIELSFTAKLLNPDWVATQKRQAYLGASQVATMVNAAYAWSATSRAVTKAQFDGICRVYVENEENRRWLAENNLYALEEITRRLLEAHSRELWRADAEQLDVLQETALSIEGDLEERIGPTTGEFQGGSVDILTAEQVNTWDYPYRVKRD